MDFSEINKYLKGVYVGEISEDDEMYKKILAILESNIDTHTAVNRAEEDPHKEFNNIFQEILKEIEEENGIKLQFSNIDNFENDFVNFIKNIAIEYPTSQRVKAIDSVVNRDYMHNPTLGLVGEISYWGTYRFQPELENLHEVLNILTPPEDFKEETSSNVIEDNEDLEEMGIAEIGDSVLGGLDDLDIVEGDLHFYGEELSGTVAPTKYDSMDFQRRIEEAIKILKLLPFYSKMYGITGKYSNQVKKLRSKCVIDAMREENPEYIEMLEQLVNHPTKEITYYYHGAPSAEVAAKIADEGLFMQYNGIDRTAKEELSLQQILEYSYGHDGVGRHAMVVIAAPYRQGNGIVELNPNTDIEVVGTGQGMEQGGFAPKYVIPSQYIVGYIDKDNGVFVRNPKYIDLQAERVEDRTQLDSNTLLESAIDATEHQTTTGEINAEAGRVKRLTLQRENPDIDKTE